MPVSNSAGWHDVGKLHELHKLTMLTVTLNCLNHCLGKGSLAVSSPTYYESMIIVVEILVHSAKIIVLTVNILFYEVTETSL